MERAEKRDKKQQFRAMTDQSTVATPRKEIAKALEQEFLDLREISKMFHIKEREALDHLQHISRSARHKRFVIEPASCLDCGFVFKKRERLSTPGKCPLCKSSSISHPRFKILSEKGIANRKCNGKS